MNSERKPEPSRQNIRIRAAFFDIDGTLYSTRTHQIPDDTMKTLHALRKHGILLFLSTGRHPLEIGRIQFGDFCFDGSVVINGQIVLDPHGNILWQRPFSKETTRQLVRLHEEKRFPMSLVESDRFYINYISERVYEAQGQVAIGLPPVDTWKGAPLFGGVVFLKPEEEYLIENRLPHDIEMTRWNEYGLDLCEVSIGKAAGLKAIGELYGIAPQEMIAFGDSQNDLTMLEYAGIGVVMGNAQKWIQEAADYVTADQDEGGIARACLHFGLIDPEDLL